MCVLSLWQTAGMNQAVEGTISLHYWDRITDRFLKRWHEWMAEEVITISIGYLAGQWLDSAQNPYEATVPLPQSYYQPNVPV